MSQHRVIWISLTSLLLVIAFVLYRLSPEELDVLVAPVERGAAESSVANTRVGTLKACRQAQLSPAIGGQLSLLAVKKGDFVQEGQLLLELWNKDLLAEKQLAASAATMARAQAESARVQMENSGREAQRLQQLYAIKAVAEEVLDKANSVARAQDFAYQAALATAETSLARQRVITAQLERTRLTAPFSGIIAEIHGELNEYLTPSPPGIATLPAIELLDTSCFYVTAPIDEVDAAKVLVGARARITMDAFGDKHFAARVRRIAPYVLDREKQARTVEVELEFTDLPEGLTLLAGYSADVEIILEERSNALRIPTQALLPGNRVYILEPGTGRLAVRTIQPGLSNWNYTEIIEGLQQGELLLLSIDQAGLKEGLRARASQEDSIKR